MTRVVLTRLSQLFTSASERCMHTHLGVYGKTRLRMYTYVDRGVRIAD